MYENMNLPVHMNLGQCNSTGSNEDKKNSFEIRDLEADIRHDEEIHA